MIGRIQVNINGGLDAREQAKASLLPLAGVEEVSLGDDTLHATYELPQTSAAAIIEVIESSGLTLVLSTGANDAAGHRVCRDADAGSD